MDGSGSTSESGESGDTSDGESEEGKQSGKTILFRFKIDTLAPSGINRHFAAKGYPTYSPLNLIPGTL